MAKRGSWRKFVMWAPVSTDEPNWHKITNLDKLKTKNGGYLGLSKKKINGDNYFIHIGRDGNDDSKFSCRIFNSKSQLKTSRITPPTKF